ncbi:MAG: ATP-binding cassette domain-containing protein, partial [Pseudomonadota bacterium]
GEQRKHVMAYMKDFLFLPEQAGTAVSKLSGGERGRLMLAMRLRHPSNLLVLDEPTNDLDLETLDLLQEMIADYAGTVLVVSHDRDFLDRVCTSVIVPEGNGKWQEYAGGYSDMVSQRGSADFSIKQNEAAKPSSAFEPVKQSVASPKQSAKMSFKDKHALETLPADIEELEGNIAKVNKALAEPGLFERDAKRFNGLVKLLEKTQAELTAAEERWFELEALREELEG